MIKGLTQRMEAGGVLGRPVQPEADDCQYLLLKLQVAGTAQDHPTEKEEHVDQAGHGHLDR